LNYTRSDVDSSRRTLRAGNVVAPAPSLVSSPARRPRRISRFDPAVASGIGCQASEAREQAQNARSSEAPGPVCALPFQRAAASSTNSSGPGRDSPIVQSPNSRSRMVWFISSLI